MAAKASTPVYEPVKKGVDPRSDESATQWLKLEPNEQVDVTCLVDIGDIFSTEQCAIWLDEGASPIWVYTGANDPSHDLDISRAYRAYLPILVDGEVKIWSMGKTAHSQLYDIADAAGDLRGMNLRLKRTGSGLKTRYSVTPRGTRTKVDKIEEVDVISMLGPLTSEGVQEFIAQKLGCEDYNEVLAKYRGRIKKGKITKVKDGKVSDDDDEEDLDDVKLV